MLLNQTFKKQSFLSLLALNKVILLDGGLSNQLEEQGFDLNNALWSASLLSENETELINAHRQYLNAGANCIITASYQASEKGFVEMGFSPEFATELIIKSVQLAHQAIDDYLHENKNVLTRPLVAASIGPYGACQADGSEYHGRYGITDTALEDFHYDRLRLLDKTNADILACETIPSLQEAQILHDLLMNVETPAWMSFSCKNGQQINDGTAIDTIVQLFADHPNVLAIGVNCTSPQYIIDLIYRIKQFNNGKAIIVYPNSGEQYDPVSKKWHGSTSPLSCGQAAKTWVDSGATIVGGCCRMGPEHILKMHQLLQSAYR